MRRGRRLDEGLALFRAVWSAGSAVEVSVGLLRAVSEPEVRDEEVVKSIREDEARARADVGKETRGRGKTRDGQRERLTQEFFR
eukprot:2547850-Rhodomonas_salina.2